MFGTIIAWFTNSRIGKYLAIGAIFLLAYFGIRAKHQEEGRQEVRKEQNETALRAGEQARQIDRDVRGGDDPRERLREWTRPD